MEDDEEAVKIFFLNFAEFKSKADAIGNDKKRYYPIPEAAESVLCFP